MTSSQRVPEQRLQNTETTNFADFSQRILTLWQKRIWIHRNKKRRKIPPPRPAPVHKLSMTSMLRTSFIVQLVYLSGCAPFHLLHTCSLAEYEKLEKVLDFIATSENTQHSSCTNSKTQQLLGGKLTPSQLKLGQPCKGTNGHISEGRWRVW